MKCVFLKVLVHSSLLPAVQALEESIVVADPLTAFSERSSDTIDLSQSNQGLDLILESSNSVQIRTQGSPTISIRGSLAADRSLSLFGFSPLQVGDGSGPAYVLLGEEIFDEIKIYKGPSSLFFGSGATGGAIRFSPQKRKRNRWRTELASFDRYNTSLQVNLSEKQQSHLQGTFFQESAHNSFDHDSGEGYSKGRLRENDFDWTRASVNYFYNKSVTSVLYGQKDGTAPPALGFEKNEYQQGAIFLTHSNQWNIKPFYSLDLQISHLETDNKNFQAGEKSRIRNTLNHGFLNHSFLISSHFISQVQMQHTAAEILNSYNTQTSYQRDAFDIASLNTIVLSDFIIEPQIRFLDEHDRWLKGLSLSRAGWAISYTEGFRNPTLNALFLDTTVSLPNPNLKPESSKQVELSYSSETTNIKAYRIEYEDLFTSVLNAGKFQTVNTDAAEVEGIEASYIYKSIFSDIELRLSYMRSRSSSNEPLPLSPRWQGLLTYSHYYGFLRFGPQFEAWQDYYLQDHVNGIVAMDDWFRTNFFVGTNGFKNWEISLYLENIFREQVTLDVGYPEPLFNYRLVYSYFF